MAMGPKNPLPETLPRFYHERYGARACLFPPTIMIKTMPSETCHKCQKAPIENAWPNCYCQSCHEELVTMLKAVRLNAIKHLQNSPNSEDRAYALRAIKRMQEKTVTIVIRRKRKRR